MTIVTNATILERACSLIAAATTEVCITSPWISEGKLRTILAAVPNGVPLRVVFRLSKPGDLSTTRANALRILHDREGAMVRYSRTLHAKTILVDGISGVVSSSNITKAGMSANGNHELGVTIEGAQARDAQLVFEAIWDSSDPLPTDCVGVLLNPTSAHRLTFVGLDPSLSMGTLVRIDAEQGWLLGRVVAQRRWNRDFFADPYAADAQQLMRPGQALLRPGHELLPFVDSSATVWNFAGAKALAGEIQGGDVLLVDALVEAYVSQDGKPHTALKAPPVGALVHRGDRQYLAPLLNLQGSVEIGRLIAQDVPVRLDPRVIASQHLSVMGMTGSGKSHFMKVFLHALKDWPGDIVVLDPHAEYDVAGFTKMDVPAALFFLPDESSFREYVKVELGQEVRANNPLGKTIIPEAWRNAGQDAWRYPSKLLDALRVDASLTIPESDAAGARSFESWYPAFERVLFDGGRWSIRLKQMDDSNLRTEIVGLILRRLYDVAKSVSVPTRQRMIVLEEAHSMIPEKSEASDVQSGKDNSALRAAIRIASEGRKFDVGLVVVTQRPAKVSKSVLSQCNTQVLFRLRNSTDLSAVASSVEGASKDVLDILPGFHTGDCFISGIAIPFPLICRVHASVS